MGEVRKYMDKGIRKGTIWQLFTLAFPAIIQNIMSTVMQYVDTAMVGHLGERATAAVSTTTTVNWLVNSLPYAFAIGCLALISQAYGKKDSTKMKQGCMLAFALIIVIGILLMAFTLCLSPLIPVWMHAEAEIQKEASVYFFIISLPMVFRCATILLSTVLQAVKDTKTPMIIGLICNGLNIVLNYILIYAISMGVRGAAIATAASSVLSGLLMAAAVFKNEELSFSIKEFTMNRLLLRELMGTAIPAMGNTVASCLGYVVFAGMVNSMGTTIFAAHSIAVSAEEIFYIPGYGLRTAASTLIGIAAGEKNQKKYDSVRNTSIWLTLLMMALSGTLLFFIAEPLMRVFTNSSQVVEIGAGVLRLVAFSEPFFGLMIAWEGISYGLGHTKSVFVIETFSMWGIRILSTYVVIYVLHLGLREVWYCMILDNICKAVLLTLYGVSIRLIPDKVQ